MKPKGNIMKSSISVDNTTNQPTATNSTKAPAKVMDIIKGARNAENIAIENSKDKSDFEKSLFTSDKGVVDFRNYITAPLLFDAFNDEAKSGVDVAYVNYQDSLLHLLQHCYGYYYFLSSPLGKERRKDDVKFIDDSIVDVNKTDNSNNPLYSKIIKLAWRGTDIDTKRISTYANLLNNAYTKGELVDGITDENGSILPEHFIEAVKESGGINYFSRISAKNIMKQQRLKSEGFESEKAKSLFSIRKAIESGEFAADMENSKTVPVVPDDIETEISDLANGELRVVLVKRNLDSDKLIEPIFMSGNDTNVDSILLEFHSKLVTESKPIEPTKKPAGMTKKELTVIKRMEQMMFENGEGIESINLLLEKWHVDRAELDAISLPKKKEKVV